MKVLFEMTLMIGIAACFLQAAREDYCTCQVRRVWWWLAGTAGILLFCLRRGIVPSVAAEIMMFGILQFWFFSNMYGKADCHGFFCSAIVLGACGGGLREFLWHELITFTILGVVQMRKKNVSKKGNLKRPVPLIPYIVTSLFLMLFCLQFGYLVT